MGIWKNLLNQLGFVGRRQNLTEALTSEFQGEVTPADRLARTLFVMLNSQLQGLGYRISGVPTTPPFTSAVCYNYVLGLVGGVLERLGEDGLGDTPTSDAVEAALYLIYGPQGVMVPTMSTMSDQICDEAVRAHAFGWEEARAYDPVGPGTPIGFLLAAQGQANLF